MSKTGSWVVVLEPGVWIAPWQGDPGRTLDPVYAMRFDSRYEARVALAGARHWRPFEGAQVIQVTTRRPEPKEEP